MGDGWDWIDSLAHGAVNDQRDVPADEAHIAPVRAAIARAARQAARTEAELTRLRAIVAAAVTLRDDVAQYGGLHYVGEPDHVAGHLDASCNACDENIRPDGSGHRATCSLVAFDRARGAR
jgi:hypothetical protein